MRHRRHSPAQRRPSGHTVAYFLGDDSQAWLIGLAARSLPLALMLEASLTHIIPNSTSVQLNTGTQVDVLLVMTTA